MTDEELRAAQVALNLVARLLYNEPTDEDVAAYVQPGLFAEAPFGMEDAAVRAGLAAMDAWCRETAAAAEGDPAALHERAIDLRSDWLNLLVGMGEPKAPSWAGYYLNPSSAILGESALEVRRLYKRHGFQIERLNQEPDDHLGLMLSFITLLIGLELSDTAPDASSDTDATHANAAAPAARANAADPCSAGCARVDLETSAAQCQAQLLQKYILPWLPLWRWSVEKFARTEFYRGTGDLVFGFVRAYATRFGFQYVDDAENPHFLRLR